ncbi:MAG: hypothetical protein QOF82_2025, partial [Frankiales bacterium]|nr:hypothetical protein [Frankiales bacterium]
MTAVALDSLRKVFGSGAAEVTAV